MPALARRKPRKSRVVELAPRRPNDPQERQATATSLPAPAFRSLGEMQQWVLDRLLSRGATSAPRGLTTLELPPTQFLLLNPRRRILTSKVRRWSLPLALGEFCWHVSGSNEVAALGYYSNRWHDFADHEGTIRGSCYGHRIFQANGGASQWEAARTLLRHDPSTRRAVLLISQPLAESDVSAKDVACATSMQLLMRNGRLDALVHMRSNDAFWGLPYDVFLFTMLQELLAAELNVKLGLYYHSVGSLHLYNRHVPIARAVVDDDTWSDLEMPKLSHYDELATFLSAERGLRLADLNALRLVEGLSGYWRELAEVLKYYSLVKQNRESSGILARHSRYQGLLEFLIAKKVLAEQ